MLKLSFFGTLDNIRKYTHTHKRIIISGLYVLTLLFLTLAVAHVDSVFLFTQLRLLQTDTPKREKPCCDLAFLYHDDG